tara:strand:+ start:355 stop:1134 length:780 start_codon:yes stop_codon:yes gene_type:complete
MPGKHYSKNMKPMMYPKNPIDGKSHAQLKAAGGKAFAIHQADHAKGVFPKDGHKAKNMHPMDGHAKNMRPGETTTEYRNRLSGKPGEFSKKLIQERKENILKQKEKEIEDGKKAAAAARAKVEAANNPNKYPKSAGLKALAAKNPELKYVGPSKYVMNMGAQERFNDSPFNLKAQQLMNYAPANKGADGYKPLMPDYSAIQSNQGGEENKKEDENGDKPSQSPGSKRLSEARKRRKEARANLKADRINRRAARMEKRRR